MEAVDRYTLALQSSTTPEEAKVIKSNRAEALIKLGRYDEALRDAGGVGINNDRTEKTLLRAVRALYELRRFDEAKTALEPFMKKNLTHDYAKTLLMRIYHRLQEQRTGRYDFKQMHKDAKTTPPSLDIATYTGAAEVKKAEGRGRGLFATRDMVPGELINCDKAFSFAYIKNEADMKLLAIYKNDKFDEVTAKSDEAIQAQQTQFEVETSGQAIRGEQAELLRVTIEKLSKNASLLPSITDLHHTIYVPEDEPSATDSFTKESALTDNPASEIAFADPDQSGENARNEETDQDQIGQTETKKESEMIFDSEGTPLADLALIERILPLNAIKCGGSEEIQSVTALFLKGSYINHSCLANATCSIIGDVQIIRAAREIPAGTEITLSYMAPESHAYSKLQEQLNKAWGFTCDCEMCQDSALTSEEILQKRITLIDKARSILLPSGGSQTRKAELLLNHAITDTYRLPPDRVPRVAMADPYQGVVEIYASRYQWVEAVSIAWIYLHSLGFKWIQSDKFNLLKSTFEITKWGLARDQTVEVWVQLWCAYAVLEGTESKNYKMAEEFARLTYKICVGEGETFDERYRCRVEMVMAISAGLKKKLEAEDAATI